MPVAPSSLRSRRAPRAGCILACWLLCGAGVCLAHATGNLLNDLGFTSLPFVGTVTEQTVASFLDGMARDRVPGPQLPQLRVLLPATILREGAGGQP